MRGSGGRRKHDATEDVGGQLLLSFGLLESLLPIGGSELEQSLGGPAADEAQQVADVRDRVDSVESGAGEQRDEDGVGLGAVVVADEKPVATAEDLPAQVQLADVVVGRKPAVIEKP